MLMPGQATSPPNHPAPPTVDLPPDQPTPKVDGVFDVGDLVRVSGQTSKLWHVKKIDPDRRLGDTHLLHPDCGCGGDVWIDPAMLLHDTY